MDLITVGLYSYNFREHVNSDIPIHGQFVAPENIKKQKYISTVNNQSNDHKMELKKITMHDVIYFAQKRQFFTRLKLNESNIEHVKHAKMLSFGTDPFIMKTV